MAFAEEFTAGNEGPAPQSFMGLPVSPLIVGVVLAVLGAGGAAYIFFTMTQPVLDANAQLQKDIDDLTSKIEVQKKSVAQLPLAQEKVDSAKLRKQEMLGFFAKDEALQTLLLDFEAIVKQQPGLKLNSLSLAGDPEIVTDGSLGESANNLFKRQGLTLAVTGSFPAVRQLMQALERFEPIVQVPNLSLTSSAPTQKIQVAEDGKIQVFPENVELTANLTLKVIVARSQAEIDQAAKEAADKAAADAAAAAKPAATPPPAAPPK